MSLTKIDKAILLGLVLGNGHIDHKGLLIIHEKEKESYCDYKAKLVHSICGGTNIKVSYNENGYGFKKRNKHFKLIRDMLYKDNKKVITQELLNELSLFSLSLWWLDKGAYRSNTLEFRTNLSREENKLIRDYFLKNYNIKWKGTYILRCNMKEGKKFLRIISPSIMNLIFDTNMEPLNLRRKYSLDLYNDKV